MIAPAYGVFNEALQGFDLRGQEISFEANIQAGYGNMSTCQSTICADIASITGRTPKPLLVKNARPCGMHLVQSLAMSKPTWASDTRRKEDELADTATD